VIGMALVPVLFHWPLLLLPAQIVLLELIIDPACSVVFESEPPAANLMARPPRTAAESPFATPNLVQGLLQGAGVAVVLLGTCAAMVAWGWRGEIVRTLVFLALVGGLFLMAASHRAGARPAAAARSNGWFSRLGLAVAVALALLLAVPWTRALLGFGLPTLQQAALLPVVWAVVGAWLLLLVRFKARPWPPAATAAGDGRRV
jgi:Ca2+-transporting ATPase